MINGYLINGVTINGPGIANTGFSVTASGVAIEFEQVVDGQPASGIAVDVEQVVANIGSGIAVDIEQDVVLRAIASGIAIDLEQSIHATASGVAVDVEQRVRDIGLNATHLERFGWDARVAIGGNILTDCVSLITVSRNENAAALARVTLINRTGQQDFDLYHGKAITIDADTDAGTRRIFTGTVDFPNVDLVNKVVILECTDRREERLNASFANQLRFVGYWSDAIFETPEDTAEELKQRLETTPKAVDFDAYGQYRVSDLLAKTTPDFTLEACDIINEAPRVQIATRARLVNTVNLEFEARWTRLRHREKTFEISTPTFCEYMTIIGLQYLRVDSVNRTLESFPWLVKPGSVDFEYLPAAGIYNCGNGQFIWSPIQNTGSVTVKKDENGNTITDANGNPVYEVTNQVSTNFTQAFSIGDPAASWIAAKRWAQDISENTTITLRAPQSINQYGAIEKTQRNGYRVEYDADDFEREEEYQSPDGYVSGGNGDYYLDKSGDPADYRKALQCAFSIAEASIIKSHRANTVSFGRRYLWPAVELYHTVAINTDTVTCRGKVTQIEHRLDCQTKRASTRVVLSLSRAQGSQAADSLSFPILDAPLIGNSPSSSAYTYELYETKRTGEVVQPPVKNETLTTPAIEDQARNQQATSNSYTYNVVLQNDPLTVSF